MELLLDLNKRYTFADYLTWIDDKRRELYEGFIKIMSPAPARKHQQISVFLVQQIGSYLHHQKCKMFHAPFDVRLPKNGEKDDSKIYTVVQPDICIICDPSKLDEKGCLGAPDMIIEIVSPSSSHNDVNEKFNIYQQAGVSEYWIVFPNEKVISVFILNNGKYENQGMYAPGDIVSPKVFNGLLLLNVDDMFADD